MYQGKNPTALQSQTIIINTLLDLMKEKAFSTISIKELCAKAIISRQTFYSLFDSKEQVLELHFDRLFQDYTSRISDIPTLTVDDVCSSAIQYLMREREFIILLVNNNLHHLMTKKFEEYYTGLTSLLHVNRPPDFEYAMAFLSGALVELIALHIKNDTFYHAEQISDMISSILSGQYFSAYPCSNTSTSYGRS